MHNYKGQYKKNGIEKDSPKRGGKYVEDHGVANETCNFLSDKEGSIYGHVETWKGDEDGYDTNININKLGAKSKDDFIDGINVIWTATHEFGGKKVIGWYKNARVYRSRQKHVKVPTNQHKLDSINSYRIVAKKESAYLIPEDRRNLKLDRNNIRTGWPGQNSVFYPSKYKNNDELVELVSQLAELIDRQESLSEPFEDTWDKEGRLKLGYHKTKERSAKLVKIFKENLTDFSCIVCGFSFNETYGELGKKYIEAHHLTPISSLKKTTKISIKDLAPVCSNCHRMLHRKNPPITIEELRELLL